MKHSSGFMNNEGKTHLEKHLNVLKMQTHLIYVPSDPLDHIF